MEQDKIKKHMMKINELVYHLQSETCYPINLDTDEFIQHKDWAVENYVEFAECVLNLLVDQCTTCEYFNPDEYQSKNIKQIKNFITKIRNK